MVNLRTHSATALAGFIRRTPDGAQQVMAATLDRIDAVNGAVNAIVSMGGRAALMAAAAKADASAPAGPLHGLPIAIKNLVDAAGFANSQGSPVFADHIATRDELYVARIRAAGAIVIGKTNTPEFGLGSNTFNPVHGITRNPYDPGRTCGGSSGGAAVALATGMLSIADGSDAMGSLRNPAGWCNVYGFRPSWGAVPDDPQGEMFLHRLATNGPMARNPQDLALLLQVMAGPDPRRPQRGFNLDLTAPITAPDRSLRIGWLGDWDGAFAVEPGILDLCRSALGRLDNHDLQDLAPPFPAAQLWTAWQDLRSFAAAMRLNPIYSDPGNRARLKGSAIWEIERGLALSGAQIHQASALRSEWYRAAMALFERYDVIALPTAQCWPFPVDVEYPTQIAGRDMDTYHRWMELMIPASLIGLPSLAMPAGFGPAGLPMGVQIMAAPGKDRMLLDLAAEYHALSNWPDAQPPLL